MMFRLFNVLCECGIRIWTRSGPASYPLELVDFEDPLLQTRLQLTAGFILASLLQILFFFS